MIQQLPNNVIQISGGSHHSLALLGNHIHIPIRKTLVEILYLFILKGNGRVYSWGKNDGGELGDGTNAHRNVPVMIQQLPNNVIQISCGGYHSLALLGKKRKNMNFETKLNYFLQSFLKRKWKCLFLGKE